ncbi:hypothetical protein Tco_0891889 [Tanacetum coccineum]|uniref:Reverse transcriptase domain-containing protein n=1 Tax=Tanacetum coccineum TaxID=301880 RepID=A0ABQ5C669_9ASTR
MSTVNGVLASGVVMIFEMDIAFYDYTIAITPDLPITDSLIMEDKHLDTILATESDELIKSIVENLVQIPSESEGIPDNMCDVPFRDNSPPLDTSKDQFEGFSDSNDDSTSIDDDSFSIDDIDYVDASPPDSELVSLEVVENVAPEDGEIDTDILLIKDDVLREKLLKINLLIAKIEALNADPTPSSDFVLKSPIPVEDGDSFLEKFETTPELETFKFDIKEKNSGSTTIYADISLSDLECFYFKSEPDLGDLTSIDPGIRENVSSTTNVNLPFEDDQSPLFVYVRNEDNSFIILGYFLLLMRMKSLISYPHQGFKAFQLILKAMMIFGGDILILDVPFLPISYPPCPAQYGESSQAQDRAWSLSRKVGDVASTEKSLWDESRFNSITFWVEREA